MNGKILINVESSNRIHGEVHMEHVSEVDKVLLLNAFVEALHIEDAHIFTMLAVRDDINESSERIVMDMSKFL